MKLSTSIQLERQATPITYSSKVLLLGSCFAQNIGAKLEYYKFQHYTNPFGVLFHPVAIEKLITRAIDQRWFDASDVFFQNEHLYGFLQNECLDGLSEN